MSASKVITQTLVGGIICIGVLYYAGFFGEKKDPYKDVIASYPSQEREFVNLLTSYIVKTKKADNDLQIASLKSERDSRICEIIKTNKNAINWSGVIRDLNSNQDGKGVISVEIAKGVTLKTWNNSFSDTGDETLIPQETPLFKEALSLKIGDKIKFSGEFITRRNECFREVSMTQNGGMKEPEFIFKFSNLSEL
ncbi:TPA: hypothetical protein SMN29_000054 [Proteus mirabilis]|nr:hypothetical protein [Proteus mirabilis]